MVEDAMLWLHREQRLNTKRAGQSTFFGHVLFSFYYTRYVEKYSLGQNRNEKGVLSLQGMQARLPGRASIDDVVGLYPEMILSADSIENNILTDCFVVPTMEQIYQQASRRLRQEMVHWFLKSRMKVHSGSKKFRAAAKEFQSLSRKYDLQREDCLHLLRSQTCLDALSRQLLWVPYDLDNPTPGADRQL